ncbi:hypothetical protein J4423_01735 [Candidatus Pacearchaeota archaeon]|nr:hypothetical protein [Candidatus Pacearchaeota archaeon]
MESNDPLRLFSIQFFKELGANVYECRDYIEVTSVPLKFQKFYGKNEPYKLVFDKSLAAMDAELITPESYLLKMMRAYLDNVGDSVLLALNYPIQIDSFIKKNFEIHNCIISKATASINQNFLFKFTFQTTYKFQNEEERFVNDVFVDKGIVINPDLSEFTTSNLNKKDMDMTQLRDYYSIAKEHIKEAINKRTSIIASVLEDSLSKEIARVNSYYEQRVKEIDEQLSKINSSNSKSQKDPAVLNAQKQQFVNEKELFVQNEQKKHSLRLNTKLITTAVMLYPLYSVEAFFKSDNVTRLVIIQFDPLNKKMIPPTCDICKTPLSEIILCNGNHLVCRQCGVKCEECGKISCETCLRQKCSVTNRFICKQCGRVCVKCKAFKNKRFMMTDSVGRQVICRSCA